jgi:sugar phosphate isomerase/epimerase
MMAGISFCLDVGHTHLNRVLEEFLVSKGPLHVHLHDNNGSCDDHIAMGAGSIDFPRIIPRLPRNASWIIEVQKLEAFDESVRFVRGTWNRGQDTAGNRIANDGKRSEL